jgi:equilibrative nucleoside transporter 1/2/3
MISVVAINIWNGIYQNCIYGVVAVLPPKYLNVVVTGMNLSGVVSSLCAIISKALAPSKSASATAYFALAVIFLFGCLVTYLMLLKNPFFTHYTKALEEEAETQGEGILKTPNKVTTSQKMKVYFHILKQIWIQLFNVFFIYFVTLLLFPAVLGKVSSPYNFAGEYFGSVFCFLSFNLFGSLGNLLIDYIPKVPARFLWIPTLARVAFIPFFLYCNFDADNRTSVVLFGDWIYSIGVAFFAITTGYFSSLAIYYAPKLVEAEHASMAGMMSSFSLMVGIMTGIFTSLAIVQFR